MNKNQWIYGSIMSEEININADNGEKSNVFKNIDCSDVFNTFQVLI